MSSGLVSGSEDHGRGFRRIVELLIWLVILPTAALLALGVLMLVFWEARLNVVFGILVVTLVGCLTTGIVLALVMLGREARLSKLQLDFVSKVSHELRTPLTSIRMFAEMLQSNQHRDPQERELCLEVLERETARLSGRIERLLDWGRMEAGRHVYERRPERADAVLEEALTAFRTAIMGRDQPVQLDLQPDLPALLVDRGAMVDALVNLLSNAYKYSGDDKQIELSARADARSVRISVRDNGIGIPRREHHRIFQKFYRVDERLARDLEGSGLGLAIVRHVATGHGGRVEVNSQPGRGSTFTTVLPRLQAEELEAASQSETPSAATA
jgi:two-component system phosphate regulon sensor histidine kinase PhoR